MKQLSTTIKSHFLKKKSYAYIFSFAVPTVFLLVFLLFSFTTPEVPKSNIVAPVSTTGNENISSSITYKLSDVELEGVEIKEAFISKMEQTKGLYTKNLNMSLTDSEGNLVALVLTDVKNGSIGTNLNIGTYFGNEHQSANQNFSIDLGTVVFSNSSNLILEGKDGSSTISRNGWIKIEKCENGLISGKFEFEIEGEETNQTSKGKFENVYCKLN